MIRLDFSTLDEMGLSDLSEADKDDLLILMYGELQIRTGRIIASHMTDEQLGEFETFVDDADEEAALSFLETNVPDHRTTVHEELEKLKAEVAENAEEILATLRTTS